MNDEDLKNYDVFSGLTALAATAFPKRCQNCGRTFANAEQFLNETRSLYNNRSGIKQSWDDNDTSIVELYRNCVCGSTLMEFFSDRRDVSDNGIDRRKHFAELLEYLLKNQVPEQEARQELLKILKGQQSNIIERLQNMKK